MNNNEINNLQSKLKEEYKNNKEILEKETSRINLLEKNGIDCKIARALVAGSLPFVIIQLFFLGNVEYNLIPLEMVRPLGVAIPTLIGIIGEVVISKKTQLKNKISKFSKAKTQKEYLEEEVSHNLEKEKLRVKNNLIKDFYERIEEEKRNLVDYSNTYALETEEDNRKVEELEASIISLKDSLDLDKDKIDVAVTRNYLSRRFPESNRKNISSILKENLSTISVYGLLSIVFYNLPLFAYSKVIALGNVMALSDFIIPFLVGSGSVIGYNFIKRSQDIAAFKKISNNFTEGVVDFDETVTDSSEELEKLLDKIRSKMLKLIAEYQVLEYKKTQIEKSQEFDYSSVTNSQKKALTDEISDETLKEYEYLLTEASESINLFKKDKEYKKNILQNRKEEYE